MKNKVKTENQKALPKYLGILCISIFAGYVLRLATNYFSHNYDKANLINMFHHGLIVASPIIVWVSLIAVAIIAYRLYHQANVLFKNWDQEDEESIEIAEHKLDLALLFSTINLCIACAFVAPIFLILQQETTTAIIQSIVLLVGFISSLAISIFIHQKVVDLTCKINPEKKGSVYDMNFKKNWLKTCDENEIAKIGSASFKAYSAMNIASFIIWFILIVLYPIFDFGILPIFLVMVIILVGNMVYFMDAMKQR